MRNGVLVGVGLAFGAYFSACGRERKTAPVMDPAQNTAAMAPGAQLASLVQENLEAEIAFSPTLGSWLGAHNFDDKLDDLRGDAVARELLRRRALWNRLRELQAERGKLDENGRLDLDILEHRAEAGVYELGDLKPAERSPLYYIDLLSAAFDDLVGDATGAAQLAERAHFITGRLRLVRGFLDDARASLRGSTPAESLVRRALEIGHVLRQFLGETLPRALPTDDVRQASGEATRALDDFTKWLERDVKTKPRGEALGRERFFARLRLSEAVEMPPEDLLVAFERALKDARRRSDEATHALVTAKTNAAELGREATRQLEEDHSKPDELLREAQADVDAILAFIQKEELFPLEGLSAVETAARDGGTAWRHAPVVTDMPPHLWGFLRMQTARPLEKPRDAILFVDAIDKSWPERRKLEYLRAFNRAQMLLRLMHEVGGHFVFDERNRRAPTTAQKTARSAAFVEGWAHYVEHALLDAGFAAGDLRLRVAVERAALIRAGRAVAAVKFHALGVGRDEIIRLFTDDAGLDRDAAEREAERITVDPMTFSDCLGRLAIEKMRVDWTATHPDADAGEFHRALLSHGSPPIGLLRATLIGSGPVL